MAPLRRVSISEDDGDVPSDKDEDSDPTDAGDVYRRAKPYQSLLDAKEFKGRRHGLGRTPSLDHRPPKHVPPLYWVGPAVGIFMGVAVFGLTGNAVIAGLVAIAVIALIVGLGQIILAPSSSPQPSY